MLILAHGVKFTSAKYTVRWMALSLPDNTSIQQLEYPIPLSARARNKKSGWRYLGNEKSYQRSGSVKTSGKNSEYKKIYKKHQKIKIISKKL